MRVTATKTRRFCVIPAYQRTSTIFWPASRSRQEWQESSEKGFSRTVAHPDPNDRERNRVGTAPADQNEVFVLRDDGGIVNGHG
jgi:hypothetical protein